MKRQMFFGAALLYSAMSFAQVNLALGGTASATGGNESAGMAIDDNLLTRWEAPQSHFAESEDVEWTLDLGEVKEFNTIQIVWEGAYSKSFVISASADGADYTDIVTVTDADINVGSPENYSFGNTTARYIRFKNVARATQWGVSFFEFRVFKAEASVLTSLELTAGGSIVKVGTPVHLTALGKDQIGNKVDDLGDIAFTVTPADAGTVDNGVYTPARAGEATIRASVGDINSNEVKVISYAGEKINIFDTYTSMVTPINDGTMTATMVGAFDDNMGSVWELHAATGADEAERTYETGFVLDFQALYDITAVSIMFEGACPEDYTVAFAGEDGVYGNEHAVTGHAGMQAFTDFFLSEAKAVRYVKFVSTKAATMYGVKIFDFTIYGENKQDITDNEAPTGLTASAVEGAATFSSLTLSLKASDNISSGIAYEITYDTDGTDATTVTASGASGAETTYVIAGLKPATTYNFSVVAKDGKGNATEAVTFAAQTNALPAAAPRPAEDEANVKSVYSDRYGNAEGFLLPDWGEQTVTTEIELAENDHSLLLDNMNYRGLEFAVIDVNGLDYLHVDVYSETSTSVVITPIWRNIETMGNYAEVAYTVSNLKTGEWNSINIPMDAYASDDRQGTANVYQIKLDGGNGKTFIFDNIYFAKNAVADTEAPVWVSARVVTVNATSAVLKVQATDNNEQGLLKYTVKSNGETIATKDKVQAGAEAEIELAGLAPETEYSLTLSVTDGSENTAEYNGAITFATPVHISATENERGVYVIEGAPKTVESVNNLLSDVNRTAYDITGLALPEGVTALTVANPNAMVIVTDEQAETLKGMKNLFYLQANTWFVSRAAEGERYEIADGYPVYTGYFISTGANGYRYTRNIEAGRYVTTTLPANITLPEGITAYAYGETGIDGDATVYTFNKVEGNTIMAHKPYILYSEEGAMLEVTGNGDLYMTEAESVECGSLTLHGNYGAITGDGSQYTLLDTENGIALGNIDGEAIGAFRAYFTIGEGTSAEAVRFVFNNGGDNGITTVVGTSTSESDGVYTIDGRLVSAGGSVKNLAKGLYIIGGKKVIVK